MKKRLIIICCLTVLVAALAQAQDLRVNRTSGTTEDHDLDTISTITFATGSASRGQGDILRLHTAGGLQAYPVASLDSLTFTGNQYLNVFAAGGAGVQFSLADVDSMTFASSADSPVTITYSQGAATVVNPYADLGVAITVSAADVTVNNDGGLSGVRYLLSGTCGDGMLKVYSTADFTVELAGVQLTNQDGPAINIQADETIDVVLTAGTTSTLTDGLEYADPVNEEDQDAAFFSEGQLIFSGTGSLVIIGQGDGQHGLGSDDYVQVDGGTIVINSADKDGIHTNEGFFLSAGSVEVSSDSDGVDAGDGPVGISGGYLLVHHTADDKKALKCGSQILVSGGQVDITVSGDQSKGLDGDEILLTGGVVNIDTSGGVVLEESGVGYDPSYCTGIKSDTLTRVNGCQVTITAVGEAGRGVSSDGNIEVLSGSLTVVSSGDGGTYTDENGILDAYHGPCLKADGDLVLRAGTVTLTNTGTAGKGISGDGHLTLGAAGAGPVLQVSASGASVSLGNGDYAEAKAVSVDSTITVDGGQLTLAAADDALKSKSAIVINDGEIDITQCLEGIEAPFLTINGGEIHVYSTDDGLNTTNGVDGEFDDGSELVINGGYVHVNAPAGDGIDSNGTLDINGGTVIVHGPPNDPEVGIDVNGTFTIDGGLVVVAQINNFMVEVPSSLSSQAAVLCRTNQTISAGNLFHIEDTAGNTLVTFMPEQRYSAVLVSSPDLAGGTGYRVYTGGSSTGTVVDGLYTDGTYTAGSLRTTFTSSGGVQQVQF